MKPFIFLFALLSTFAADHLAIATFDLTVEPNHINVSMEMDTEELEQVIRMSSQKGLTPSTVYEYLSEHMIVQLDGQSFPLTQMDIQSDWDTYVIKASIPFKVKPSKIRVQNTCFIHAITKHSNIVKVKYNGKSKGYRMHQRKTEIEVLL